MAVSFKTPHNVRSCVMCTAPLPLQIEQGILRYFLCSVILCRITEVQTLDGKHQGRMSGNEEMAKNYLLDKYLRSTS